MELELFWSDDLLAQGVIVTLAILFGVWVVLLFRASRFLNRERQVFDRLEDVDALIGQSRSERVVSRSTENADSLFARFLELRKISASSIAAGHVRSIFDAGWSSTRLELAELNRTTMDRLFRQNSLLKSILSLFIIIGLFGTLAGLSKALISLSSHYGSGANSEIDIALQQLLVVLRSAFAPSVDGVFLTVVGVLLYAVFDNRISSPLRSRVDELTHSVWLPKLYPTASQRVLKTMEEADRLAHDNLNAAKEVVAIGKQLEIDLADFGPKIGGANEMLTDYTEALAESKETAIIFSEAAKGIAGFKDDILDTYDELIQQTEETHLLLGTVSTQNQQLEEGIKLLRVFEDSFIKQQEDLNVESLEQLKDARKAINTIVAHSGDIVKTLGDPLLLQLKSIDVNLHDRLEALRISLSSLEDPIKTSVAQIAGIATSFNNNMTNMLGELKREFDRQNTHVDGETVAIADLAKNLQELLTVFKASSETQEKLINEIHTLPRVSERSRNRLGNSGWFRKIVNRVF